jgi:hypothetical protein
LTRLLTADSRCRLFIVLVQLIHIACTAQWLPFIEKRGVVVQSGLFVHPDAFFWPTVHKTHPPRRPPSPWPTGPL